MKFFRKLTIHHSTRPTAASQPMLQPLERRRLMSLSGAPEYPPALEAPIQVTHSFGFENHLRGLGAVPPQEIAELGGSAPAPAGLLPEMTDLEAQFARAIARGAEVVIDDTAAAMPTAYPPQPGGNSLSEMYSTLNHSTIAEIDSASIRTGELTTNVASHTADSSPIPAPGLALQQQASSDEAAAHSVAPISPAVPLAGPALADAVVSPTPSTAAPTESPELSRGVNAIEADLVAVGNLAGAAISELGRDMGIQLSHLQDDISAVAREMVAPWDAWRFAALTGAAVATAAYLQARASRENERTESIFSRQLIEILPGDRR